MKAALILAMLIAPGVAQAQVVVTLTLAEARAMTPQALAVRVLGEAAANDVVDVAISGDTGGLVPQPGLDSITFYRTPRATGFAGLCRIEQVYASFSNESRRGEDLPHTLRKTTALTQFATRDGDCAALKPLNDNPRLFSLGNRTVIGEATSASDAQFGILALRKALADANARRAHVTCKPDPADASRTECVNPLKTVTRFPLAQIETMQVYPCMDNAPQLCVMVRHSFGVNSNSDRLAVTLTITTDAVTPDPAKPFKVRTVTVGAETWADD